MSVSYFIPDLAPEDLHRCEEIVRRSRFIVSLAHTPTPKAAKSFIERIKQEFPDATHYCWAYAAGAPGQQHRGQRQRGHGGRERYEFLLHRLSHRPEPGRRAPFPHDAFASTAFLLYCTKARGQYSTAVEKRNPLRSGTGDGRRKRSEREPAAAPKRKRDDGHHIEAAPR